jgi:hypothetical protein
MDAQAHKKKVSSMPALYSNTRGADFMEAQTPIQKKQKKNNQFYASILW